MSEKIFLHLLILCGILSNGIIGTLAGKENDESSDVLDRQKRVISYVPGEDTPVMINNAPFVVYIKQNQRVSCTGSILSFYVAITAASCVSMDHEHYKVVPGSTRSSYVGHLHNVTEIRTHIANPHERHLDGVSLLIVTPRFPYTAFVQPINLYSGPLLVGTFGKVHGWGYNYRSASHGTNHRKNLRSIEVPIISFSDCENRYQPHIRITQKNLCTYHPQKHCGHNDFGAGLVVGGTLAGVFLWSGLIDKIDPHYPDVYASLLDPFYNDWIRSNLESIGLQFEHLHRH